MKLQEAILAFNNFLDTYKQEHLQNRLLKPVHYILSSDAKRLRPAIVVWLNQLYNGDLKNGLHGALAIEMFHNFSLVHDDIMDEAPLRRGKETVHSKWGNNTAILSGDAMLVLVYKILTQVDEKMLKASLELFNDAALNVCEGQQLDMDFEDLPTIKMEEYITMIGLKTGDLLGASFALGALLANANQNDSDNLYSFGKKTGIAFQLQDDILDLYGDQKKVGKQKGGDVIANKKTALWISALEKADKNQRIDFQKMANERKPKEKVKMALALFEDLDVRSDAEALKLNFQKEAFQHLDALSLNKEAKNQIKFFAENLLNREY
jgi:geranylgeranyl diphosphate synthase type II